LFLLLTTRSSRRYLLSAVPASTRFKPSVCSGALQGRSPYRLFPQSAACS